MLVVDKQAKAETTESQYIGILMVYAVICSDNVGGKPTTQTNF